MNNLNTAIHQQVALARQGQLSRVIKRLASGWLVMGEAQVVRGYCLLLPDPVVPHLNALTVSKRREFLEDATRIGDVLLKVTGALRINYEILGNLEPALHLHLFPRYAGEPDDLKTKPIWFYDWKKAPQFDLSHDGDFMAAVAAALV